MAQVCLLFGSHLASIRDMVLGLLSVGNVASHAAATTASDESSSCSHRYLGEKRCRLCKQTSTSPNPVKTGPLSVFEYRQWLGSCQGLHAEGLWCAICYNAFTFSGFLEEYKDPDTLILAMKTGRQVQDEWNASTSACIEDMEVSGKLRLSKKAKTCRIEKLRQARQQIVESYDRDEFQLNEKARGVNEERFKEVTGWESFEAAGAQTFWGQLDGELQEMTMLKSMPRGECEVNLQHAKGVVTRTIQDNGELRLRQNQAQLKHKHVQNQLMSGAREVFANATVMPAPAAAGDGLEAALAHLQQTPIAHGSSNEDEVDEEDDELDFSANLCQVAGIATKRTMVSAAVKARATTAAKPAAKFVAKPAAAVRPASAPVSSRYPVRAKPPPNSAPIATPAIPVANAGGDDAAEDDLDHLKTTLGYKSLYDRFVEFMTKKVNAALFNEFRLNFSEQFQSQLVQLRDAATVHQKAVVALDIKTGKRTTLPKSWHNAMKQFRNLTWSVLFVIRNCHQSISGKPFSFEKCKVAIESLEEAELKLPSFFHQRMIVELAEDLMRCGRAKEFVKHAAFGYKLWELSENQRLYYEIMSENIPKLVRGLKDSKDSTSAETQTTVRNFAVFVQTFVEDEHKGKYLSDCCQTEFAVLNSGLQGVLVDKDEAAAPGAPDYREHFDSLLRSISNDEIPKDAMLAPLYGGSSWTPVTTAVAAMLPNQTKTLKKSLVAMEVGWHAQTAMTVLGFSQADLISQQDRRHTALQLLAGDWNSDGSAAKDAIKATARSLFAQYLESYNAHFEREMLPHVSEQLSACIIYAWERKLDSIKVKSVDSVDTKAVLKYVGHFSEELQTALQCAHAFGFDKNYLNEYPLALSLLTDNFKDPIETMWKHFGKMEKSLLAITNCGAVTPSIILIYFSPSARLHRHNSKHRQYFLSKCPASFLDTF